MQLFRERVGSKIFMEKRKTVLGGKLSRDMDMFKEKYLTPHEEMEKCRKAYNSNGLIYSAVDNLTDFFIGNDLICDSVDTSTKKFFQDKIDGSNPDMFEITRETIEQTIKTGNGYIEVEYDDNDMPVNFYSIPDSSRIYINSDPFGQPWQKKVYDPATGQSKLVYDTDEYYIQRVDDAFDDRNTIGGVHPKWYQLTYTYGGFKEIKIKGIPIPKRNILHFKWGTGDVGTYGRSFIASVLDDHEILKRMEKAMGIIAKYKAVPKKILMPAENESFSNEDSEELATYFQGLEDDENAILTKRVEMGDLSFSGKTESFSDGIDHVRRKIISGLTPEFLLGYGMDTNKATADQLLIAFMLRLETKRKLWEKVLTKGFIKPYLGRYSGFSPDAKISFGNIDFRTNSEKNAEVRSQWQSNQITFNEMRKEMGKTIIPDGNVYFKDFMAPKVEPLPVEQPVQEEPQNEILQEKVKKRAKELLDEMRK